MAFIISEAARFNIVQFAVMNILNFNDVENIQCASIYKKWSSWLPIIKNWKDICEKLADIRGRGLKPLHTANIPISTGIMRFNDDSYFKDERVITVLQLISENEFDKKN